MRRGEIWLIRLDPTLGAEIRKTRPAVIVSSDAAGALPLKVVVPLTDWKDRYQGVPWMVRIEPDAQNHLDKTSAADTFQIRSIDRGRFIRSLGVVAEPDMTAIAEALVAVLEVHQ